MQLPIDETMGMATMLVQDSRNILFQLKDRRNFSLETIEKSDFSKKSDFLPQMNG
jgi:hypothetical protein